jgi:hypothetical protein
MLFSTDFGLIVEARTREQYTRVNFENELTVYVRDGYTDYNFTGRHAEERASEFAKAKHGHLKQMNGRNNTVRFYTK